MNERNVKNPNQVCSIRDAGQTNILSVPYMWRRRQDVSGRASARFRPMEPRCLAY